MLKRFIKNICYRIFKIGYYQNQNTMAKDRVEYLNSRVSFDSTSCIYTDARITNNAKDKERITIGIRTRIMGSLAVYDSSGSINIGQDCYIGPNSIISSAAKIEIGSRVLVSYNVNIQDHISHPLNAKERYSHNLNFFESGGELHALNIKQKDIIIEDDVWIGFNSTILRGVKIGQGAIIGACSVVTKDVEPWTINVGNPSRCIKKMKVPVE